MVIEIQHVSAIAVLSHDVNVRILKVFDQIKKKNHAKLNPMKIATLVTGKKQKQKQKTFQNPLENSRLV